MLTDEAKENARKRWMAAFEKIYDRASRLFSENATIVIANTETMEVYGEDGKEYTLQVAPWEREGEDEEKCGNYFGDSDGDDKRSDYHRLP